MPNSVFPQQKPSMSLEQAIAQTIAHCKAGQWREAEVLYQALRQTQSSSTQGQYWLSYIDALIQAGKPHTAPDAPAASPTAPEPAAETAPAMPPQAVPQATPETVEIAVATAPQAGPAQQLPAGIRVARAPNPCYTARLPRWPWKMALGCGHVPASSQTHLLLAHYHAARYPQAETLARSLTHAFPRHDLGWKVLIAVLQLQGRTAEAEQTRQQRRASRASRRKNVRPASPQLSN